MEFVTSRGRVAGHFEKGCIRISRLRYAKPPVGSRRFAMPEPVDSWEGVLDAGEASVAAPQLASRLAGVMGDYPLAQSEDCLHLDIWIPKGATAPMPVVVFVHGGAFMTGAGGMDCYNGAELAVRQHIVVVNLSYRLGVLGFLPIAGVAAPNLGLHDQIIALRFIREEIGAFGGDSANITVVGQSAGAYALAALLAADELPRLFDRAVLMSAPFGIDPRPADAIADLSAAFCDALGVAAGDADALRQASVVEVLKGQAAVLGKHFANSAADDIDPPFMPVVDDALVKGSPRVILEGGGAAWCPFILGATREEYAAFWFDKPQLEDFAAEVLPVRFEEAFPGRGVEQLDAFMLRRCGEGALAVLADLHCETKFVAPARTAAAGHAAAGGHAYVYSFDWQSPDPRIAACHCIELPFFFGNLDSWAAAPMIAGARADELARVSELFQSAIGAFARSGDPACASASWPGYDQESFVMHIA